MPYLLLIVEQPEKRRKRPAEEGRLLYERMLGFTVLVGPKDERHYRRVPGLRCQRLPSTPRR